MSPDIDRQYLNELLKKDHISKKELQLVIDYFKQLTHELGNGTFTRYKANSKQCKDIIKCIGELNDILTTTGESK